MISPPPPVRLSPAAWPPARSCLHRPTSTRSCSRFSPGATTTGRSCSSTSSTSGRQIEMRGPGRSAALGRAPRLHLVHPRRLLRPQPAESQRRRRSARPIAANTKPISEARRRRENAGPRESRQGSMPPRRFGPDDDGASDVDGLIRQTRQPQFISSAYFLRFKFDEGTLRAGRPRTARRPGRAADRVLPRRSCSRRNAAASDRMTGDRRRRDRRKTMAE